jgi:hypothetical protein
VSFTIVTGAVAIFTDDPQMVGGHLPSAEELGDAMTKAIVDIIQAKTQGGLTVVYVSAKQPAPPLAKQWRVKVAAANVRAGPGTGYAVLKQHFQGDLVAERQTKDGWVEIEPDAWMSGIVLEAV